MKVLISGAGPAGLTVAYWLKHYGMTPTIVERAPALLTGGYKIDVRGKALEILKRMGIHEAVVAANTDMQRGLLVDKDGSIINEMSGDTFGHRVGDDLEIIRGTLCQILLDKIPDVEIIFGDSIQKISELTNSVQVEFSHHEAREFDLVIGADGVHSNVRQLVFGDESKFLHSLGLYLCVFTIPNYLNLDRVEIQYSELGRTAAAWSAHGEPNMKACFAFTAPLGLDREDRQKKQEMLKKIYHDVQWEVPRFLQMMTDASDFYFDICAQTRMDSWSKDRVALVGDAAYCPSPMSGQGTSAALIGAYVLAGELAVAQSKHSAAFAQYENEMRPYIKLNQEVGEKAAEFMRSQEKPNFLSYILQFAMKVMPGRFIQFLIKLATSRINKAANAITLKDY